MRREWEVPGRVGGQLSWGIIAQEYTRCQDNCELPFEWIVEREFYKEGAGLEVRKAR